MESARARNADALLYCELDVETKSVYFSTVWYGTVTLTLVSVADSSRIMFARYNTGTPDQGISPTSLEPPEAVHLATAGAVRSLVRGYVESK
jgi:hypothetical protein